MAELKGDISPGCKYVVATWTKRGGLRGRGNVRHVESCHKTLASARQSLAAVNRQIASSTAWGDMANRVMLKRMYGNLRAAIYTVAGKRVK